VGQNNIDYLRWCGMPPERIVLAPHSIDTRRFADPSGNYDDKAAAWRRELGIGEHELVLVYAGKLIAKKDPDLLLEAFAQLRAPAHLVIFGSGELEGVLKARSNDLARVHFLPFQNQSVMPAVYRVGDLFVLPSRGPGETWGLALNEAMACGRAIIASSKVGGARDLIRNGSNGWVFESGNLNDLVRVLEKALAGGRTSLRAMGEQGRLMAEHWSTEVCAASIAEIVSQGGMRNVGEAGKVFA
jgi:glycosyltransferase involved in cell wall biosynthesis